MIPEHIHIRHPMGEPVVDPILSFRVLMHSLARLKAVDRGEAPLVAELHVHDGTDVVAILGL